MMKLNRRVRIELSAAIIMTIALTSLAVYVNRPKRAWFSPEERREAMLMSKWGLSSGSEYVQVYTENINGELKEGSFETVVEGVMNLTSFHGGRIPDLNVLYENDIWVGTIKSKIPTENVTLFTFDARELISKHGKVTYISTSVTETVVNETQPYQESLSEVSLSLRENEGVGIELPIISQIGSVVPWLVTSLVWIAQGLIIGVPLCFVSLGIVVLINRGIVPAWKKQFRSKSLNQPPAEAEA
jgi:hypothetical protein